VGVEHDPGGLWWGLIEPGGEQRVIGERRADADRDGVALARQRWTSSRLSTLEIQRESPVGEATRPSSDIAAL
jgi:hypothetical protein